MVQVICWVVGEYGTLSSRGVESIMDKLAAIPDTQTATEEVRPAELALMNTAGK